MNRAQFVHANFELCRDLLHAGVVQRDTLSELIGNTGAQAARKHVARELLAE